MKYRFRRAYQPYKNIKQACTFDGKSCIEDFLYEFEIYSEELKDHEKVRAFGLAMRGQASLWFKSIDPSIPFVNLEQLFRIEFAPQYKLVEILQIISVKKIKESIDLLHYLDKMKSIANQVRCEESMLVLTVLKELPKALLDSAMFSYEDLTWDKLYTFCKVWNSTELEI